MTLRSWQRELREIVRTPESDNERCPVCGTDARLYLGQLGNLHHYRCRDCGAHYHTEAK